MPSIILHVVFGAFFIMLFIYSYNKYEFSDTALIITIIISVILISVIECIIFENIAKRADVITMKTWNQYLIEAREYRKNMDRIINIF